MDIEVIARGNDIASHVASGITIETTVSAIVRYGNMYHAWFTFNNSSVIPVWNEVLTLSITPDNTRCGLNGAMQALLQNYNSSYFDYMMYFAADTGVIGCRNNDIPSGRYCIDFWF